MLYLLIFETKKREKKEIKREKQTGGFFSRTGCSGLRFSWLLGAIKSCFKGQS
jgi:hypothetical protein